MPIKVTILIEKTYNTFQDASAELDQAENLGFILKDVQVSVEP